MSPSVSVHTGGHPGPKPPAEFSIKTTTCTLIRFYYYFTYASDTRMTTTRPDSYLNTCPPGRIDGRARCLLLRRTRECSKFVRTPSRKSHNIQKHIIHIVRKKRGKHIHIYAINRRKGKTNNLHDARFRFIISYSRTLMTKIRSVREGNLYDPTAILRFCIMCTTRVYHPLRAYYFM